MESDPLLDLSARLFGAVFEVEDVAPNVAGNGPDCVGDGSADPVRPGPDEPPGTAAGGLALLVDHLLEDERAGFVEPAPADVAHLVGTGQGHLHGAGAFGPADEELLGGGCGRGGGEEEKR